MDATAPTDRFNAYEEDFQQIVATVRDRLDGGKDDRGGEHCPHAEGRHGE